MKLESVKDQDQGGRSKSRKRLNECSVNDVNLQSLLSKQLKLGMHDYSCCSAKEHALKFQYSVHK